MIQEFICPNGRMSVNGVCPIFEGDDGQAKNFKKKSTYDAFKEDEIPGEKDIEEDRKKSSFFKFDFEKPTENAFEKAENIISKNIGAYNDFVESTLGIPSSVQSAVRIGSSAYAALTGGSLVSVAAPFAIPFVFGAALNNQAQKQQEAAISRESTRDLQYRIDKGEFGSVTPTPQDKYRGGGQYSGGNTKSSSGGSKSGGFSSAERGAALHG